MTATPKGKVKENIKAILIALLAALILRQFVIASYNVPTGSMKDTILVGDFMFVNKFVYGARTPTWLGVPFTDIGVHLPFLRFPSIVDPEPGDIVVFEYPLKPHLDYIKRCMAIGGQTVEGKERKIFVDGKPEGEETQLKVVYDPAERSRIRYTGIARPNGKEYVIRHRTNHNLSDQYHSFGPKEVPANHYFMCGDNRDNSEDSRAWGFVEEDLLVGKPLLIWLSVNTSTIQFSKKIRWERLGMVLR